MSENTRTPFSFYLVVGGVGLISALMIGAVLFLNWERLGLPKAKQLVQEVQEAHTGEVEGAVVAEGNAANYLK